MKWGKILLNNRIEVKLLEDNVIVLVAKDVGSK